MQMFDCIIVFVLEELTLSLYELHRECRDQLGLSKGLSNEQIGLFFESLMRLIKLKQVMIDYWLLIIDYSHILYIYSGVHQAKASDDWWMMNDDWLLIIRKLIKLKKVPDYWLPMIRLFDTFTSFICGENKNIPYEIVHMWNKNVIFAHE